MARLTTRKPRQRRTKPKQAGSPRSLDTWQRKVRTIRAQVDNGALGRATRGLNALLASMERAERR